MTDHPSRRPMSPEQFKAARRDLGLSLEEMARLLGYAIRQQIRLLSLPPKEREVWYAEYSVRAPRRSADAPGDTV